MGELSIPILNILVQYSLANFIDSNILFQYDVDKLIEIYFILSLRSFRGLTSLGNPEPNYGPFVLLNHGQYSRIFTLRAN
jgi:hypothetical protein